MGWIVDGDLFEIVNLFKVSSPLVGEGQGEGGNLLSAVVRLAFGKREDFGKDDGKKSENYDDTEKFLLKTEEIF